MKAGRVILLIGVGIIAVMVLMMSIWLIPYATTNTPLEGAVDSLWTFTIGNIFFGLFMLGAALSAKDGASNTLLMLTGTLLIVAGIGALLFGFWILDGAFSFLSYGPSMQVVATVMFACVAGDWLAGVLAFVGFGLLTRSRKREFSPE